MHATRVEDDNLRGVHRLAGAVLVQAIQDMRSGSGRKREDAIRWITDTSDREFSFVYCCRMLNRNPDEVRQLLVRRSLPSWLFANSGESADASPEPVAHTGACHPASRN